MSQDAEGFSFVMFFLQPRQKLLPWLIVAKEQHGGFGKGPLEVSVTDFLTRSAQAFAAGFLAAFDQA